MGSILSSGQLVLYRKEVAQSHPKHTISACDTSPVRYLELNHHAVSRATMNESEGEMLHFWLYNTII